MRLALCDPRRGAGRRPQQSAALGISRRRNRHIDLAIEQVIQRMPEGTRQQLPRQIDRQHSRTCIDVFVPDYTVSLIRRRSSFDLDAHNRSA